MQFRKLERDATFAVAAGEAALVVDYWDDWKKYRTQFSLWVCDQKGEQHEIGKVKIGQAGLLPSATAEPGKRTPMLANSFELLGDDYFSVGQSESYYESLNQLSPDFRAQILSGLRDMAFDLDIFDRFEEEYVVSESLLRDISAVNIRNRFHRLSKGDATLTKFNFNYRLSQDPRGTLDFHVEPNSMPPTNLHVLIGRNGVGKTRAMQQMARWLVAPHGSQDGLEAPAQRGWDFANLLFMSFSAFDEFKLAEFSGSSAKVNYVGLKIAGGDGSRTKSTAEITDDFLDSLEVCRRGIKRERWKSVVDILESDPVFNDADIVSLMQFTELSWRTESKRLFEFLSSGHKIVLLSLTKLVEYVEEKSLVLIDEPEGHLHPPLLSAYTRALCTLLSARNAVALIATHSPVVLQEVPKSCVWIIQRAGNVGYGERPEIETFGENVGVLTREVFGLEVSNAGFHGMIKKSVLKRRMSYAQIMAELNEQLGAEGRAIARSLADSESKK